SFQRSRRSELHTLREVSLLETHAALRRELGWVQQASHCAALIEQTTEKETPLPVIFELMRGLLAEIPKRPPQAQTVLAFELKLLDDLGLKPELGGNKLTPGAKLIIEKLALLDWQSLSRLRPSSAQCREIQQFLHGFLIFNFGKIPEGRTAALAPRV